MKYEEAEVDRLVAILKKITAANYRRRRTNENKYIMNSAGRLYKKSINKAFEKYQNDLIMKIRRLKSTNPKAYWDVIKDEKNNKNTPKSPWEYLKKHFKKLNKCETKNKQNITNECNNDNNEEINTDFKLLELKNAIKN